MRKLLFSQEDLNAQTPIVALSEVSKEIRDHQKLIHNTLHVTEEALENLDSLYEVYDLVKSSGGSLSPIAMKASTTALESIAKNLGCTQSLLLNNVSFEDVSSSTELVLEGLGEGIKNIIKKIIEMIANAFNYILGLIKKFYNLVAGLFSRNNKIKKQAEDLKRKNPEKTTVNLPEKLEENFRININLAARFSGLKKPQGEEAKDLIHCFHQIAYSGSGKLNKYIHFSYIEKTSEMLAKKATGILSIVERNDDLDSNMSTEKPQKKDIETFYPFWVKSKSNFNGYTLIEANIPSIIEHIYFLMPNRESTDNLWDQLNKDDLGKITTAVTVDNVKQLVGISDGLNKDSKKMLDQFNKSNDRLKSLIASMEKLKETDIKDKHIKFAFEKISRMFVEMMKLQADCLMSVNKLEIEPRLQMSNSLGDLNEFFISKLDPDRAKSKESS
jgi:hypothetical protein